MDNKEKNIVLIGLTGCGKTTVGKMLAQKMNYDFIDMDDFIVESTGKTVPELFAKNILEIVKQRPAKF